MSNETYLETHDPDSPLVTRTVYMKRVLTEAMHLATLREYREMPPHLLMAMAMVDLAHTDRIDQGIANVEKGLKHLRDARTRTMTKDEMVEQDARAFRAMSSDDTPVEVFTCHKSTKEERDHQDKIIEDNSLLKD